MWFLGGWRHQATLLPLAALDTPRWTRAATRTSLRCALLRKACRQVLAGVPRCKLQPPPVSCIAV